MSKSALFFKNPLVLVIPVVAVLMLLWQQYTLAQPQLSTPQANILPNANLDELDSAGFPVGWQLSRADDKVTATSPKGYNSPTSLALTNKSDTINGNTTLTSPEAVIEKGVTYLYKAFYKANTPFDLLIRTNNADGSHEQTIVGRYDPNTEWETVSYAFTAPATVKSVQFIYSFSAKGELQIDNTYLEPNPPDVYLAPQPTLGVNILSNHELITSDGTTPIGWSPFTQGNHSATLQYLNDSGTPALRSHVERYVDGEAKWQYEPISVKGGQAFQLNVTYQSDTPAEAVAEFTLTTGKRQFVTIKDLLPAKDWTEFSGRFEAPMNADTMLVTIVQRKNGTITTKDYGIYNITKSGVLTWDKPRLSFTFDDGWESAYTNGAALLNRYGYEGTFYLNPSTIDTANFMTSDQVAELVKNGHEIASHGYEHLNFTTLKRDDINYQFEHASNYFKEVHNMQRVSFAAPFGGNDPQTTFYARKYYASLRGTIDGVNTKQNLDPYNLRVLYVGGSVSPERLSAAIADAKSKNGWLILIYHRVETPAKGETILTPTQFQQQLDTIKNSDITVEPVADVLKVVADQ
jgi:peptidoglycan/xylan/chitin deacetylase (PgdA/CDA1 family)